MPKAVILVGVISVAGCAEERGALHVKQFTLRDDAMDSGSNPMVRNEKLRRLYGAVGVEERKARLGQYYTILWKGEAGSGKEILFEYLQGKSGSRVKSMRRELAAAESSGREEFAMIGDDYFEKGRVLAWKASLLEDGRVTETRQSYLWE